MRAFAFLIALSMALHLRAQPEEHPFIESFSATVQEGRILLHWVMKGGSTCDGSAVERSVNGGPFAVVHRIEGLCGDPEVAVPYAWADDSPPELSTVSYRIALANEGRSTERTVEFRQLLTSEHRVYPSPTEGVATVLLRVPLSARVDLVVRDGAGRVVLRQEGRSGREHRLDLGPLPSGTYTYEAVADGRPYLGRVVKR